MVHTSIVKIFSWLSLMWIHFSLKSIRPVVVEMLCKSIIHTCDRLAFINKHLFSRLRNVRLNLAAADGYADNALTVESCRCPANYTGTSCEKCAEGYGRPHPLVGIYLGQCWSCRSICNDRADRCDRDTGKCQVR